MGWFYTHDSSRAQTTKEQPSVHEGQVLLRALSPQAEAITKPPHRQPGDSASAIRGGHEGATPKEKLTWLPEELDQIRAQFPQDLYGPQGIADLVTGHRETDDETGELLHRPTERLAEHLAGIEKVTWEMLRDNAVKFRRVRPARNTARVGIET